MARSPAASRAGRRALGTAVLAAVAVVVLTTPPAGAQTAVVMRGLAFVPATVAVQQVAGEPGYPAAHGHVVWTNEDADTVHTVTFDDPRLASSGRLVTGQPYEVVLTLAGSFTYHCTIHPSMTGTVVVSPAPASPATAGGPAAGDPGPASGGGATTLVLGGAGLAAAAGVGWVLLRRRRAPAEPARQ